MSTGQPSAAAGANVNLRQIGQPLPRIDARGKEFQCIVVVDVDQGHRAEIMRGGGDRQERIGRQ